MACLNELATGADQTKMNIMPINIRRWRVLWRRIKKEKKRTLKLFDCSTSTLVVHVPYNPCTYSKNFDQGSAAWADPDVLSRSFSDRFAVPRTGFNQSTQRVSNAHGKLQNMVWCLISSGLFSWLCLSLSLSEVFLLITGLFAPPPNNFWLRHCLLLTKLF